MKLSRKLLVVFGIAAVIVAVAIPLGMIRKGFSARAEPSQAEALLARAMRKAATPARLRNLRNPVPLTEENLREGLEHFADHCAVCHANNGDGKTTFGQGMYPKPPDMRTGHTQQMTDGEIYSVIQNGIRLTGMPAFGQSDREDDVGTWQLVHFIRHLPKLTPDQEAEMKKLNPKTAHEWMEEKEIEDFLNDDPPPAKPKTEHNH